MGIRIAKTIAYERDPDMTTNWMAASIGMASAEGPGNDAGIILHVYPNPSNGWVSYDITSSDEEIYKIKAYDSMGRLIAVKDVQTDNEHVNGNWDLTGLRKGIYFIQAEGCKSRTSKAIIIQ